MDDPVTLLFWQLLPITIVALFLAWGNYLLAAKSGRSGVVWVVLTLIPLIGFFAT
jgi:hypothetical protein